MWVGIGISIFSIISSMIIKGVQANHYYAQPMAFLHGNWTQGDNLLLFDHPFFANRLACLKFPQGGGGCLPISGQNLSKYPGSDLNPTL